MLLARLHSIATGRIVAAAYLLGVGACAEPMISAPNAVATASNAPPPAKVPLPKFDRVDYRHPEQYRELLPSLGDRATIERVAATLESGTTWDKLRAIAAWMDEHVR